MDHRSRSLILLATCLVACDPEPAATHPAIQGQRLGVAEFRGEQQSDDAHFEMIDAEGDAIGSYQWSAAPWGERTEITFDGHVYEMRAATEGTMTVVVDGTELATIGEGLTPRLDAEQTAALHQALEVFTSTQPDLDIGEASAKGQGFRELCRFCETWIIFETEFEFCLEFEAPYCFLWPV